MYSDFFKYLLFYMTHKITEFYPEFITRIIDNSKLALDVCHLIEDGYTSLGPFSRDGVSGNLQFRDMFMIK